MAVVTRATRVISCPQPIAPKVQLPNSVHSLEEPGSAVVHTSPDQSTSTSDVPCRGGMCSGRSNHQSRPICTLHLGVGSCEANPIAHPSKRVTFRAMPKRRLVWGVEAAAATKSRAAQRLDTPLTGARRTRSDAIECVFGGYGSATSRRRALHHRGQRTECNCPQRV
jgi:hypothetical protein